MMYRPRPLVRILLAATLACGCLAATPALAADAPDLDTLSRQLEKIDAQLKFAPRIEEVLGDAALARGDKELVELKAKVDAAQKDLDAALNAPPLAALRDKLAAARKTRDDKVLAIVADAPSYVAFRQRLAAAETRVKALEAKLATLAPAEVEELARAREELHHLGRQQGNFMRALWQREEAAAAYKAADALYKDYGKKRDADKTLDAAEKTLKDARDKLAQALRAAGAAAANDRSATLEKLAADRTQLTEKIAAARKQLLGDQQWHYSVEIEGSHKKGAADKPAKATLWIPPNTRVIRGVLMGHPPAIGSSLTHDATLRVACAQEGIANIHFEALDALFDYSRPETLARFEKALADFAAKSNHPELVNATYLTVGHSTSGIFCRNVAYWRPERTVAVIHVKSGNMHQHRPDPARTLVGVPFLAVNGEFEEFGPEGGVRKEYGLQTQWVMIREQLLRFRAQDPRHYMSLLVHPGGGHMGWSQELSRYSAAFIRKACAARIPKDADFLAGPVKCRDIKPEEGWLTDANLTSPAFDAAPYAAYKGDKAKAFWHADEDMARATIEFHKDKFVLPDPALKTPVPADWPPVRK